MNNQYKIDLQVLGKYYTIYYPAETVADAIDNAVMHIINNISVDYVSLDPKVHKDGDMVRVTDADKRKFMIFIKNRIKEYKYAKFYETQTTQKENPESILPH